MSNTPGGASIYPKQCNCSDTASSTDCPNIHDITKKQNSVSQKKSIYNNDTQEQEPKDEWEKDLELYLTSAGDRRRTIAFIKKNFVSKKELEKKLDLYCICAKGYKSRELEDPKCQIHDLKREIEGKGGEKK